MLSTLRIGEYVFPFRGNQSLCVSSFFLLMGWDRCFARWGFWMVAWCYMGYSIRCIFVVMGGRVLYDELMLFEEKWQVVCER